MEDNDSVASLHVSRCTDFEFYALTSAVGQISLEEIISNLSEPLELSAGSLPLEVSFLASSSS